MGVLSCPDKIRVERVRFEGRIKEHIKGIRHAVFTCEQQVDPALDLDGQDLTAVHALVMAGPTPVATGRMLDDGHIGRVAVLKPYRGIGAGQMIVNALVGQALENKMPRVFLGAQIHAVSFYERLGFAEYGYPYEEAGISHIHMEKILLTNKGTNCGNPCYNFQSGHPA
ncbi:MAG: GNAT family N-acetyltransferase [Desulfobacter sp.]|nr:GNAT family N-acetyltransferase [Desulfobacter sp.]